MQTLSHAETQQAAGGIAWTTPAAVAILDTASFGPLVFAFTAGYAIGTWMYHNVISPN